ncbi:hypothetical protein GCM10022384_44760 [Streptomyces marokkonensis]|uniref:Uncharacterized protein n=1 Tax=Streptomyces marokkonensis TaxID=324855 RepID=A0ABP7R4V1_9ACTN
MQQHRRQLRSRQRIPVIPFIANAGPLARDFRRPALKTAFVKEVGADPTADDIGAKAYDVAQPKRSRNLSSVCCSEPSAAWP